MPAAVSGGWWPQLPPGINERNEYALSIGATMLEVVDLDGMVHQYVCLSVDIQAVHLFEQQLN
jgi:hypothetical protein